LIVPSVAVFVGVVALLGLGTWQLEREQWKRGLIETLERRLAAAPVELPVPDNAEFTRVRMRVEYLKADDALAYTSGSALRDDVKSPGYFVFSPVRLPNGQLVVVNRGYTPDRSYPRPAGSEEIVGAIRQPEAPSLFVTEYDSTSAVWFTATIAAWRRSIAGAVAPFVNRRRRCRPAACRIPRPSRSGCATTTCNMR
jgi:cytochrome oxidase assembly protein ShyY1